MSQKKIGVALAIIAALAILGAASHLFSPVPKPQIRRPTPTLQPGLAAYFVPDANDDHFTAVTTELQAQLGPGKVAVRLPSGDVVSISFPGSNPDASPEGQVPVTAQVNDYRGSDEEQWRENVTLYEQVLYPELYPGIDLRYTVRNDRLKSEFVIHPEGNIDDIRLQYDRIEELRLANDGTLRIDVNGKTTLREALPYAYQIVEGQQEPVTARFRLLDEETCGFEIDEALTPGATLVIDPELRYATYFGGTGGDDGWAVATDFVGNTYVTGVTWSDDLPILNPIQSTHADSTYKDVFIAKFDAGGDLVYATYFGGAAGDEGNGIAADSAGNAYVVGETYSRDLPTHNAWQPTFGGNEDVYALKLDPQGHLLWATYIGRDGFEEGSAITVDGEGRIYIAGEVYSDAFPLINPWRSTTYGEDDEDGFIAILNPQGQLIYSTYVSGPERDQIFAIAVDQEGHVYAAGMTSSPSFPVYRAIQPTYGGGWEDGFILKLDPWTNELHFATFLGGLDREACRGIDFDQERNIYVSGYTSSPNFPTVNAYQSAKGDGDATIRDAFVAKLSPSGTVLHYATYLGGSGDDRGQGLVVDHLGHAYVTGQTDSLDFPTRNPLTPALGGTGDGFVAIFNPDGTLHTASYVGGTGFDRLLDIALDGNWVAHMAGQSSSPYLATADAYQTQYAGQRDAFISRVAFIPTPTPTPTPTPYAAAEIGPEGGTLWLAYPAHLTLLQVPVNALNGTTTFELIYDERSDSQGDLQGLNHFFALTIADPQFVVSPLEMSLGFQETRGVIANTIDLYRLDAGSWVTSGITITGQGDGYVLALVTEPGIYGLLGQTNRVYLPTVLRP